jgi:hypothetical protein
MTSSRTTRYHIRTINKSNGKINTLEKVKKNLTKDLLLKNQYNDYYIHSYNYLYEVYSNLIRNNDELYEHYSNLINKHDRLWGINDDLSYKLNTIEAENKQLKEHNNMH